jgi:hypothetical protein
MHLYHYYIYIMYYVFDSAWIFPSLKAHYNVFTYVFKFPYFKCVMIVFVKTKHVAFVDECQWLLVFAICYSFQHDITQQDEKHADIVHLL